jgi:hypothetical protein
LFGGLGEDFRGKKRVLPAKEVRLEEIAIEQSECSWFELHGRLSATPSNPRTSPPSICGQVAARDSRPGLEVVVRRRRTKKSHILVSDEGD